MSFTRQEMEFISALRRINFLYKQMILADIAVKEKKISTSLRDKIHSEAETEIEKLSVSDTKLHKLLTEI